MPVPEAAEPTQRGDMGSRWVQDATQAEAPAQTRISSRSRSAAAGLLGGRAEIHELRSLRKGRECTGVASCVTGARREQSRCSLDLQRHGHRYVARDRLADRAALLRLAHEGAYLVLRARAPNRERELG